MNQAAGQVSESRQEDKDLGPEPIVFFDGVCVLCHRSVAFLLRHDRDRRFRFARLQGDLARRLLGPAVAQAGLHSSSVLYEPERGGGVSLRSRAVLLALGYLPAPWRFAAWLASVPGLVVALDVFYGVIARNRYRWFGRYAECPLPDADLRARLLD